MAIIERRDLRYFGLPLKQAFRGKFWLGCLWGFAGDLGVAAHAARSPWLFLWSTCDPWLEHQSALPCCGGSRFLLVGFFEEFLLRGYAQFTLTLGIGFWPAAVLLVTLLCLHAPRQPREKPRLASSRSCSLPCSSASRFGAPEPCGLRLASMPLGIGARAFSTARRIAAFLPADICSAPTLLAPTG